MGDTCGLATASERGVRVTTLTWKCLPDIFVRRSSRILELPERLRAKATFRVHLSTSSEGPGKRISRVNIGACCQRIQPRRRHAGRSAALIATNTSNPVDNAM